MVGTLDDIKKYLKVDGTDADAILSGYQAAAETWLTNCGCTVDYANKLCEVIIATWVGKMYENPEMISGTGENMELTLVGLVEQLRLQQKEAAADASGTTG